MKVAHFAPFAPARCGLYEAARDCVRADVLRGHEAMFVDTGVCSTPGVREPAKVGAGDHRGGWLLETSAPAAALDADLWVCHDGVSDSLAARCQAPMVWMIHGRPLACFRPEQNGAPGDPFSILPALAAWPRVKALVTMWSEFETAWRMALGDKLVSTGEPPVDAARYKPDGPRYEWKKPGERNLLICDSWRDDVDVYEVAVACWWAATQRPGIRVHFWGVEERQQRPWQHVWRALDKVGALGEIHPRETDLDRVMRAADAVVSPHRIAVRTISEALTVGTPVVAARGCRYTRWQGDPSDPEDMGRAILDCLNAPRPLARAEALASAQQFSLSAFGERMEEVYAAALGLVPA